MGSTYFDNATNSYVMIDEWGNKYVSRGNGWTRVDSGLLGLGQALGLGGQGQAQQLASQQTATAALQMQQAKLAQASAASTTRTTTVANICYLSTGSTGAVKWVGVDPAGKEKLSKKQKVLLTIYNRRKRK